MKTIKQKIFMHDGKVNTSTLLYKHIKQDFTFHTSAIEGSKVSETDNAYLSNLDKNTSIETITTKFGNRYKYDDIVENFNCGVLFDYVLETIDEPFSEKLIKEWHNIIKRETQWSKDYTSSYGEYKQLNNTVGGNETAKTWEVPNLMENLLKKLNNVSDIQSIALQHCEFESIHPFLDGNGRVGRMIMLKQCFQNNIYPFIIDNDSKRFYYNAIEYYRVTGKPDAMTRYLQQQQEIFKVKYVKEKNKQLER